MNVIYLILLNNFLYTSYIEISQLTFFIYVIYHLTKNTYEHTWRRLMFCKQAKGRRTKLEKVSGTGAQAAASDSTLCRGARVQFGLAVMNDQQMEEGLGSAGLSQSSCSLVSNSLPTGSEIALTDVRAEMVCTLQPHSHSMLQSYQSASQSRALPLNGDGSGQKNKGAPMAT